MHGQRLAGSARHPGMRQATWPSGLAPAPYRADPCRMPSRSSSGQLLPPGGMPVLFETSRPASSHSQPCWPVTHDKSLSNQPARRLARRIEPEMMKAPSVPRRVGVVRALARRAAVASWIPRRSRISPQALTALGLIVHVVDP